jgi:FKBP-type peptidyl-prolyl cis-trans isomerase 2
VDFNHPLSSQDITYDISIKGVVTDPRLKVEAALNLFRLPHEKVETDADKIIVTFKTKIPEEVSKPIIDELKKLTDVKEIEFR